MQQMLKGVEKVGIKIRKKALFTYSVKYVDHKLQVTTWMILYFVYQVDIEGNKIITVEQNLRRVLNQWLSQEI